MATKKTVRRTEKAAVLNDASHPYCYLNGILTHIKTDKKRGYTRVFATVKNLTIEEEQRHENDAGYEEPEGESCEIWMNLNGPDAKRIGRERLDAQGIEPEHYGRPIELPVRVRFFVDGEHGNTFGFASAGIIHDASALDDLYDD